jgi:hypothetical protein
LLFNEFFLYWFPSQMSWHWQYICGLFVYNFLLCYLKNFKIWCILELCMRCACLFCYCCLVWKSKFQLKNKSFRSWDTDADNFITNLRNFGSVIEMPKVLAFIKYGWADTENFDFQWNGAANELKIDCDFYSFFCLNVLTLIMKEFFLLKCLFLSLEVKFWFFVTFT